MDLADIPFGVPVILQTTIAQKHPRNLKNAYGTKAAVCLFDNQDVSEQMILHRTASGIAIQSVRNQCYLRVNGTACIFDSKELVAANMFKVGRGTWNGVIFHSANQAGQLRLRAGGVVACEHSTMDWELTLPRACTFADSAKVDAPLLATKERYELILELAKCGKSADEIEQLVKHLVDAPASAPPA